MTRAIATAVENVLFARVVRRFPPPRYVTIRHVGDRIGFPLARCDVLAVGCHAGTGYGILGFEIKATRGDLQRELANPAKADWVKRYCDSWWLVVPDRRLVDGLTIPDDWGILVAGPKQTRPLRWAPVLDPLPPSRQFVAEIARRLVEQYAHRDLGVAERIEDGAIVAGPYPIPGVAVDEECS